MKNLKKTTFRDYLTALLIGCAPFLVYVHDSGIFDGMKGFSGFSSLRLGIWVVSLFVLSLIGFIGWFLEAKGKRYRFAVLAPIFMLSFQLSIYLLDARDHTTNDFSIKTIVYLIFVVGVTTYYFFGKRR